jgi:hypothetical protein
MALCVKSSHPSHRCYVVKLHRDARGARGGLRGRVEHLATGRWFEFVGAEELAAALARDLATEEGGQVFRPDPEFPRAPD